MPRRRNARRRSSSLKQQAEIKVIEFEHQELMVFIQLLFGITLAAVVAATIPYLSSSQFNTIILYDIIVGLLLIVFIILVYYTKLKGMKQKVLNIAGVRKGQAVILWVILAILIILFLQYSGILPRLLSFIPHP